MDPDSDSPVSRVERTFWTVWYYITGAVNRLLRPEPTDTVSSDPNSLQESASNSEPADNGLTQGDTSREEVDEERPLAAATVLSLSGAVVAWEICKTKDSDSKEDEESTEHESLLIEGSESKVSEEGESTREGQFSQAENDDAGLLSPKDSRAEKAEEDETVQLPKDEQVLEEEDDTEIKLCTITESGLEKDDNRKMDEPKVQSDDNPTALMPEELEITSVVSQLVSEHIKESDEGEKPEISVCELWSDSDTGVKLDTGKDQMTDHKSESDEAEDEQEDESMLHEREQCEEENVSEAESKETIDEESEQEEDIQSVREDSREKDILTKFVEGSIDDLQNTEPESKVSEEGENTREGQFSQAENDDVGLLSPKDSKAEKAEEEEESVPEEETQRTMTPEDPKKMDETVQLPKYEQVLEEEDDTEIKLCTITESGLEKEDNMQMDEPKVKRDDTTIALMPEELEITSVVSQLVSEYIKESDEGEKPQISVCELWTDGDTGVKLDTGKHQMTDHKSESDESEDEQEDESMLHEREQCEEENVSEAERKETIDEESEQEEDIQSVREDSREKDILTKCVARSIDDLQNAEPESKVSEEGENMREEQFSQTENGDAGLLSPKDSRAEKAEEEEESVLQKVEAQRQVEDVEYEETLKTESLTPTDVGMNEITEEETQRTMAPEDPKKMDETLQLQEEHNKRHPEDEQHDTQLYTITESGEEEEDNRKMVQSDDNPTALMHEELEIGSGVSQLVYEYVKESDEGEKPEISVCELWSDGDTGVKLDTGKTDHKSESDESEDVQEEEDESMLHEREQCEEENVSEAESKETIDEESEQEEDIQSVREDSREKDILTKCVASSIDETVLHTAEFTYEEEEEDMAKNSELHRKTREADDVGPAADEKLNVTSAEVSVNDTFFDKDHVEEERLFTETHMSNTLETEAETGQEKSGEFKNISLRMCEGEVVVSRELNSPTCGETREGVPEYNNEPGPDENSTQRFLEVVDCEEIQSTQLPEEVGGKESESLQNSGDSTGADGSLAEERGKEQQESAEDSNEEHSGILDYTQTGSLQETETALIGQEIKESGVSFKEEDGKLLVPSMKTATEQSEKELETRVGSEDECDETTGQQKDGTEELLVEFEADEGFSDLRDDVGHGSETRGAEAAEEANEFTDEPSQFIDDDDHEMADARSFQDSVGTVNLDQHCTMTPSLLEGFIESGLLKPKTTEDGPVDRHSAVIDGEETAYGPEEQATGSETRKENQMGISNLQLVTPLEETDKNESAVWAGSEAFEISNEETVTETEAADEFTADEFKLNDVAVVSPEDVVKHETESEKTYAKDEGSSISGNQDVIDEEILDLWIQVASSQNADDMKQQTGVKIVQSNEENAEISSVQTETNHERESEAEMSSLSAEPGFLEQPVSVWDTQNSPTQPELLQDIYDTLASISESTDTCDISTQQFQSEAQDSLMEEAVRTGQSDLKEEESLAETGFHPDSGVLSSEDRQEKVEGVELVESETQKDTEAAITDLASRTDWKEIKEADFKSPKEEVEETNFEGGAFGVTASHSPNEFKLQSRQSKGALEVLSEEGIVSTESGLQLDTGTESENLLQLPSFEKPQPGWSEGGDESFPEQNRANVEELTTESEGLTEVDASTLDFTAQRSRIAVKNPRVRPPKDARSLLHMPSVEPTPSTKLPVKVPAGVPLGGLGIGIKLPGLGAGFPVLRKTRVEREENSADTAPQKPETKPEDKKDTPKQDEVQHRPKWMPPKQQGFGNPLMSELKSKLKKPTKE